jgi:hypothetical protein
VYTYDDFAWVSSTESAKIAQCTTPWEWYLATKVYIYTSELSGIVCPVESDGEADPPLGSLHVITAVQPGSEPDSDENLARMDVLDRELRAAGIRSTPAIGASFDGKHGEESRAVFGLDDAQARRLGRRFGQVAIFSWTGPRWSLLASAGDRKTHRSWRWNANP